VQLSPHFYLEELTHSEYAERNGINNTPNPLAVQNLFKVAAVLEQIRALLGGKPILVSSGYRSPELNRAIGGSSKSEHMTGNAADFKCPGFGTPLQICHAIVKSGIKFGQLIQEGSWVHISAPDGVNDGDVLTAHFTGGSTSYTKGLA
jgi:zinc D-Ala-D-Ala carboxypeptidase